MMPPTPTTCTWRPAALAESAAEWRTQITRDSDRRRRKIGQDKLDQGEKAMSEFKEAMRRVITGDDASGNSVVIIDGGPSSTIGDPDVGGLFEIWEDAACGPLDPKIHDDLGTKKPVLGPRPGNVQVRWFVVAPTPEGVSKAQL